MPYGLHMARGNRKRSAPLSVARRGNGTVVSTQVDARSAAFGGGRGVMPPPVRVHDANKSTNRYQRRQDKRRGHQAMRSGNYDDL